MRTELKIGVTVVLVVSVMVLVYFVFFTNRGGPQPPPERHDIAFKPDANRAPAAPGRGAPGPGSPARPPGPSGPLAATPGARSDRTPTTGPGTTPPAPVETVVETDVRPPRSPGESIVAVRTEPPPTALLPPVSLPPARTEPNRAPARPEPSGFTPTPIYAAVPGRVETTAPPVDDRAVLSTVRSGMAEANVVRPAAASGLVRKADGKDYYTVQQGDKGYWGIAAKPFVYADGSKWDLIQKANPGVDPSRLRAGQELVIPPAPAAAGPGRPAPVALTPTTRPAGSTTYAVKSGDTLETIARTHYGNGALWPEIAKANPGVEPNRLRIGQELVLPSAEDARRAAGLPAAGTTTSTTRPALARTSPTPPAARSPTPPPAPPRGGWD